MAIIKLTRGFITEVDDELYEELSTFPWYASGPKGRPARRLRVEENPNRSLIYIYHQILKVNPWQITKVVDHIDGNPLNNKVENLRIITHKENMQNIKKPHKGIAYCNTFNRYKAYIDILSSGVKCRINVGTFATFDAAVSARESKLKELADKKEQKL